MSIQPPPSSRPREIGVTEPLAPAYERMKQMLFKPFDLAKWITIGFCAWLAGLGEAGGGGGGGFNGGGGGGDHRHDHGGQPAEQFRHFYHEAADFVNANLFWIVPLAVTLLVIGVTVWLLVLWLSSRGTFMFLHCVALDKAEVVEPWTKFAGEANSLFRFRIVMGLIAMVLVLPLLALTAVDILAMVLSGRATVAGVMMAVGLVLALIFVAMVLGIIRKFMVDFVVTLMFLRGGSCLAAWREFGDLLFANPGKFTLYILFQIVLSWGIGLLVLLVILLTCCIAGCLMALPFLGTVLLLPVLAFKRAYPLYYLAQYGPQYDVFPAQTEPVAPPAPPLAG
ncbi:MAG TPA: hypothetical protein VNN22_22125 [Verrucomicrobiae bacterium]|nr:hypothetical protein [Verrucomicrobiae bacterium]